MFRKSLFVIAALISLSTTNYAAEICNPLNLLISKTLEPTPIIDDLRYLTDQIGGRPTGSVAMNEAMQWSLKRFQEAGFNNAHLEKYTAPKNWLANIETGEITAPQTNKTSTHNKLRLAAMPFTLSTPPEGLVAPVYAISSTDTKEIKAHANEIKGHWLLVQTSPMLTLDDMFKEYLDTLPLFAAAKKAGAVGILWQSNRSGRLLYRHNASLDGNLAPLPAALIEREGGKRIVQLINSGEVVTFKAKLDNVVQDKPQNYNVVAEIKGSEKPEDVIIIGAHLDSWDLGQGALDNGCNAVMIIDIARQMKILEQKGIKPKRTIRFMLYSGEELGLYGSWFDVKNHAKQLDAIKAVVIYDIGTGRTTGFSLGGRSDMVNIVNHALKPIANLGPFTQTTDAFIGTDNFDYLLQGIPTIVANQDVVSYLPYYHAESDTFDKVDSRELKLNAVIASVLTWNLANTDEAFPARQTFAEVSQLLESTGVKKQMEIYGIWDSFIKRERN
ncbi:M28 family peptidase [Legionella hackeliae]|uniref:Carboxypeptidase Q n=1 Tax=Legionella hackeliae TaxID=449 RepID=A0A0A8UQ19_LEGHA|nr:M28 family peptidase [Legionella hackeliae]KTD09814.1 aminopeptidase [Legionella hackeliae]CEK10858.1 Peptidase M28 family protein [Legionella hackeliae]STX47594.1 aminopeptidase [Legionella hackeliae]